MQNYKPVGAICCIILLLMLTTCGGGDDHESSGSSTSFRSITLAWDNPAQSIFDISGYKIYYGTSSGNYDHVIEIENVTQYTLDNISSGTICFAVKVLNVLNYESDYSNEVCKKI